MSPDVDALRVQGPPRERLLPGRATASLLAIALTILIFTKGIVPAMSTLDTDFPNYLTAARIVADGGPANRLYDTPGFKSKCADTASASPRRVNSRRFRRPPRFSWFPWQAFSRSTPCGS